ncbi:glycosyltransferase [Senegalia sp. (in: firmicutes)]|uniref:glycosyltransferase n=1 Tax=Senegalia sp. (in: firmicutes) TaxID=1924098 RepID=UPI003F9E12CB
MQGVSIVIPAYNEEKSIRNLLDKLKLNIGNIKYEAEIIIVDANSNDRTVRNIIEWKKHNSNVEVKIIEEKSITYPGKGRNIGVENSKYNYIAFIDCGIVPEENWLEKLLEPFKKDRKIEVVWGISKSLAYSDWERAFSKVIEAKNNEERIVRSSAIKKNVFKKIDGFEPDLRSAEDLIYIDKLKKLNINEYFVDAKAYYTGYPKDGYEAFKKWTRYTKDSVKAGYIKRKLILSIALILFYTGSSIVFFILSKNILLYIGYLYLLISLKTILSIFKNHKKIENIKEVILGNIVSISTDLGRLNGLIQGIVKR